MTGAAVAVARRWLSMLAALTSLIAALPSPSVAQQTQASVAAKRIVELVLDGRNLDAVEQATQLLGAASPADRQDVFQFAAYTCWLTSDVVCTRDLASRDVMNGRPLSEAQPKTVGYSLLLWSYGQLIAGDYQSTANVLGPGFPLQLIGAVSDPVLFADLQLLAARRSRLVSDYEASRDHLDKALASTLSLLTERFDAQRLIVGIIYQLLDNHDIERALRLATAADPLLQAIPPDSFLAYEFLQLRAILFEYAKDFASAATALHQALARLDRLQLRPSFKEALKADTYNNLLGIEVLRGDRDAARNLLRSHPLMSAKSAILARGYFANGIEFNFALGEEFVRLILADRTDTGWGDLLKMPPRWLTDPEEIQDVLAFGQAAVGLRLVNAGKREEARHEFVEAGRKRLSTLGGQYRKSGYASPLPRWADLILMQFAIAATLSDAAPDYDLIVQAHAILNRTIATSVDDALTIQAAQTSDEGKRLAQTLRTIQVQQAAWEKAQLAALIQRLSSPPADRPALGRDRLRILYAGNNFAIQQKRLHAALAGRLGANRADSIADLTTVKQMLLPDEALVMLVPVFDSVGKICIRADQTISSVQKVDSQIVADARLLRAALTATHPASNEADSQFPAAEAVRIGKLMFGGLDDCLRRSSRLYLVSVGGGPIDQVPPAAVLVDMPPTMGAGFDLKAAHWMIRDHSFVRTSSIPAFLATKKLSKTRRASLDYLGIGDPVLAARDPAKPSAGAFAARGSLPVQSGPLTSLPELPETSDEVQGVAGLFDGSKVRILRRENATEEEFRLQPLSEFDVVHFATHGLVKEEVAGLREPSLVLTPTPDGDAFNDGLLTGSQIAALPLKARLVVLSACNSARYEPSIIDDGIQGLATSFAVAGVPSAIASLWPIESMITHNLIIGTFQAARDGNIAIADALALAMRKHLDGPTPRPLLHPRFWAALVALGDGALKLTSDKSAPHDLGPFDPVDPSNGDEIRSGAAFQDDFITATIGAWKGKRSLSLIRRQTIDGVKKWEIEDAQIGVGLAATAEQMIYAGGYLSYPDGTLTRSVPVLRGLSAEGKVLWSHQLPSGAKSTYVAGLAIGPDQSALALVGPSLGDETGATFSLIRVDPAGTEIEHLPIPVSGDARWGQSGYLTVDKGTGLAVINRNHHLDQLPHGYNGMGVAQFCFDGDAAEIVLVDLPTFRVQKRLTIDRFQVRNALADRRGWLLVGDAANGCDQETHAAAYRLNKDGTIEPLWRDSSPFQTSARAARKVDGLTEIVGYAQRIVAVREDMPELPKIDFSSKRSGNEAYTSEEIFSVRLSEQGGEQRRDFVGAGFPIAPQGMASTDKGSVIYGSVGSRALWMRLPP
jgi:CHAT domain-containing protein